MSKIKAISLRYGGATLGRKQELAKIKDDEGYFVVPIGAEVAVDLTTLGAAGQDVGADTVIAEGLCYAPRFEVRKAGSEQVGEIYGTGGQDQAPNHGFRTEPGYPEGFGFGESRWKTTRGYGFIVNQLADNDAETIIVIKGFLTPDGQEIESNSLGIKWAKVEPTLREKKAKE